MKQIAVIGGGAAGLAAAVRAGQMVRTAGASVRVSVLEADERVGRSILRTGNGRCNVSNAHVEPGVYCNADFVEQALRQLEETYYVRDPAVADEEQLPGLPARNAVLDFLSGWGLVLHEEAEGRLYPVTNKATTVLNVLRSAAAQLGVEERVNCRVESVEAPAHEGGVFTLRLADGSFFRAQAVIVACGGTVARDLLQGADVPFVNPQPVLGPLRAHMAFVGAAGERGSRKKKPIDWLAGLNNIRISCAVSLLREGAEVARQRGEVLFRKYGVSGIAVFNLSRFAQAGDMLSIDLLPDIPSQQAPLWASRRHQLLHERYGEALTWEHILQGLTVPAVTAVVCAAAGARPETKFAADDAAALAQALKSIPLQVDGVYNKEYQCQVQRGGFGVDAFTPTCQLRTTPGLFVVGEALDVDAPCGGYNLHWAWASGLLAAQGAVDFAL
ncbi:MAG: FAD-dependent oxidoreductase [Coriobacteriia bacterium]|nr:FAD-dependent oxidoreductase [Coriobacteriia bacterium]